jgi:hypothetical protein
MSGCWVLNICGHRCSKAADAGATGYCGWVSRHIKAVVACSRWIEPVRGDGVGNVMRQQRRSSRLTTLLGGAIAAVVVVLGAYTPPAGATSVDVATEAEYRQAIRDLSLDPNGPHTINVTDDIVLAEDTDTVYIGDQDLTISGNGTTISGAGNSRVFASAGESQNPGVTLTITFTDVTLTGGWGGLGGGAVIVDGAVTIENSTLHDNESVAGIGGAVAAGRVVTIENSTLHDNETPFGGGAVVAGDVVTIENSTLHDNEAGFDGGAVLSFGDVVLSHATLSGNAARLGANVRAEGEFESFGSVLADPLGDGDNCAIDGATASAYSYDTDDSCGFADDTDISGGGDPGLGALADNGGPTLTMLPQPGSPLIDAIPVVDCLLTTDQRGIERPQGDGCDIGAVEVTEDGATGPDDVMALFDEAAAAGDLVGTGPGNSGPGRLDALRNMLVSAGDLLEEGDVAGACAQLQDAANRTDGAFPPPDFVQGPATSDLHEAITDLHDELGCFG